MPRCRFVQGDIVRLPLSEGDYVDVKKELTAGEMRRVFAKQLKPSALGEPTLLDPEQVGRAELSEYVLAWSFVDAQGKPVPVSDAAIDMLDVDSYRELQTALDAHKAQVEREKKTIRSGVPVS